MNGDQPNLFAGRFWDDLNFLRDDQQTPGGPIAKLILLRVLSRIGPNRKSSSWTDTVPVWLRGLLISRSTLYAKLGVLRDAGLASYDRDGERLTITICRANFREPEFLPSGSRTGPDSGRASPKSGRAGPDSGRSRPDPGLAPLLTKTTKPPTPPKDWAAAAVELFELGMEVPRPALDAHKANGGTIESANAIIAHYRQHAARNGWGPGALHARLKHHYAGQAVDVGWPESKPGRSAETPERSRLEDLKAMPAAELDSLAEVCLHATPALLQEFRELRADDRNPLKHGSANVVKFLSRGLNEREAQCSAANC